MTSSLKLFSLYFNSLLYKTNRFQVAVHLFSNRSQRTSKCGKNISDTLGCASCATFLFLPHFHVICDLLLNRRTTTWNLFVNCIMSYSNGVLNLLNNTNRTIAALIAAIKSETKKETLINSNFLKRVFYEKRKFNNFPRKVDSFLVDLTDLTSYKSGVVDNLFSLPITNNELTLFGLNKSNLDIP